jgi:hypothetical protein
MLGLTSHALRRHISVSYTSQAMQVYIDCAKACIKEEVKSSVLEQVAGRSKPPGLPSWCPDANSTQGSIYALRNNLYAGINGYHQENRAPRSAKRFSQSNVPSITGFRADTVAEIVDGMFHWPNVPKEHLISRAQNFLDWEARCLKLAQRS